MLLHKPIQDSMSSKANNTKQHSKLNSFNVNTLSLTPINTTSSSVGLETLPDLWCLVSVCAWIEHAKSTADWQIGIALHMPCKAVESSRKTLKYMKGIHYNTNWDITCKTFMSCCWTTFPPKEKKGIPQYVVGKYVHTHTQFSCCVHFRFTRIVLCVGWISLQ